MLWQLNNKRSLRSVWAIAIITVIGILAQPGYGQTQAPASSAAAVFTDPRNGKTYRTVKIGSKTWMAENLNFQTGNSWCYDNAGSNCTKYGRLYSWHAALKACPAGWRLPDTAAWNNLIQAAGGDIAGTRLKSKTGWSSKGNGTDEFDFSALPGGRRYSDGHFAYYITSGRWWSATEFGARCANCAYYQFMDSDNADVWELNSTKGVAFSVRCIKE